MWTAHCDHTILFLRPTYSELSICTAFVFDWQMAHRDHYGTITFQARGSSVTLWNGMLLNCLFSFTFIESREISLWMNSPAIGSLRNRAGTHSHTHVGYLTFTNWLFSPQIMLIWSMLRTYETQRKVKSASNRTSAKERDGKESPPHTKGETITITRAKPVKLYACMQAISSHNVWMCKMYQGPIGMWRMFGVHIKPMRWIIRFGYWTRKLKIRQQRAGPSQTRTHGRTTVPFCAGCSLWCDKNVCRVPDSRHALRVVWAHYLMKVSVSTGFDTYKWLARVARCMQVNSAETFSIFLKRAPNSNTALCTSTNIERWQRHCRRETRALFRNSGNFVWLQQPMMI